MEGVVEHAVVLLDVCEIGSLLHTRARARFGAGGGPRFRVDRQGVLGGLGKMMGAQDVVLGDDPAFDERFLVRCDDERSTRLAWTHRARRLMFFAEQPSVESDGSIVTITIAGYCEDVSMLETMLDLAGELASYGTRELADLSDLSDVRWVDPEPPWDDPRPPRLELDTPGGTVVVRTLPGATGSALQMTIETERELSTFAIDVEGGRLGAGAPRGLVPSSAEGLLRALGDAALSGSDRRVRLAFSTVPAREVIEAGAQLLSDIAGTQRSAGAFR